MTKKRPPIPDDVSAALGLLRDSLGTEEERICSEGSKAMQAGDYETATAVIDFAKQLLSFQKKVEALVGEWSELEKSRDMASPQVQEIVGKRFFGKSKHGEVTPHEAFCQPLLEVLMEMGGRGKTKTVLDRVGIKMKQVLKPKDFEGLESDPKQIRWRNAAQWARNKMANEDGRMCADSPRGVWEISEKGKNWLARLEKRTGK